MKENLKIKQLIQEERLAEVLGISMDALLVLRSKGCPYLKIGKKIIYHESMFMEWILTQMPKKE